MFAHRRQDPDRDPGRWSQDTWGSRPTELKAGHAVDGHCQRSDEGCTLNGSADYYIRNMP